MRCDTCQDDGWVLDHDDQCYEDGDCSCSGVQVPCPSCGDRTLPDSEVAADEVPF